MGYICQERLLYREHPFFVAQGADTEETIAPLVVRGRETTGIINIADDGDTDLEEE